MITSKTNHFLFRVSHSNNNMRGNDFVLRKMKI